MSDSVLLADDHPVDPDDELLCAFMDNELSDDERKSVEERLMSDDQFRSRLNSLQSGWDWLNELPSVSANEKLVESTIELVVADIEPLRKTKESWITRNRKLLSVAALSILGLTVGALAMAMSHRGEMRKQLADIAIAEDLDAYLMGDDFDFFRELDADSEWRAMLEALEAGGQPIASPSLVREVSLTERPAFLRDLPLEQRRRLEQGWKRFEGMKPEQRDEVRRTAEAVSKQADSERLLKTMKAFWAWRDGLDDKTKDALQSSDKKTRREALKSSVAATRNRLARRSGTVISDETADIIYLRLHHYLQRRIDTVQLVRDAYENQLKDRYGENRDWECIRMMVEGGRSRFGGFRGGDPRGGPRGGDPRGGDPRGPRPSEGPRSPIGQFALSAFYRMLMVTDDELLDMVLLFDEQTRDVLGTLTNYPTQDQRDVAVIETLRAWAKETVRRNAPVERNTSLIERYRARDQTEILDLMEPRRILESLEQDQRYRRFGERWSRP